MDPTTVSALVQTISAFLLPNLAVLMGKASEGAASEIGKKTIGEALTLARKLWSKLSPKIDANSEAQDSLNDVLGDSNDLDAQAAFRRQLKKILLKDDALAGDLANVINEAQKAGVTASGDRSVAVGQ